MVSLMRAIIVTLAVLVAMVLLLCGIRELRTKRGRYGLFVSTLLAALSIGGCNTHTKVQSAADPPDAGTGQAVAADVPAASGRMAELAQTTQWADFKALWKELDRVRPTKEGEGSFTGEYYGSITYEQAQEHRAELDRIVGELGKPGVKKLVGGLELELLADICHKRINYLEYGLQSMMTRMVQPPMVMSLDDSIRDLELHIDLLVDLREQGKISTDEFLSALAIVEDDIKAYSILDTLSQSFVGYWAPPISAALEERATAGESVSRAENLIEIFEKDYADFQDGTAPQGANASKEIAAQYEKAKKAVDELKLVLPFFTELIQDLET